MHIQIHTHTHFFPQLYLFESEVKMEAALPLFGNLLVSCPSTISLFFSPLSTLPIFCQGLIILVVVSRSPPDSWN